MSETKVDSEDNTSTVAVHGSESLMQGDNDTESEEENGDPMVEEMMQKHKAAFKEMKMNLIHAGLNEQTVEVKAYSSTPSKLQNELESVYLQRLVSGHNNQK